MQNFRNALTLLLEIYDSLDKKARTWVEILYNLALTTHRLPEELAIYKVMLFWHVQYFAYIA